ncbi:MAG: metallophosphoesterase family protein [Oscillospiraceae bacterium]|nr:metallophosphoesterase family protein [Oscillospiraceae bacterium]
MKILVVADIKSPFFFDCYTPGKLKEFDLILSCGDLSKEYLEFLVTMARCPLYYVPGNHDESFDLHPPEGCESVDGRLIEYQGVRILGLGGSYQYRPGSQQYTERQMASRIRRLNWTIRRHMGFDILLTHAPARGINDLDTPAHRGFECFNDLIDRWQPKYLLHGHVHLNYGMNLPRKAERGQTKIVNAYEYSVIEI